MHATFDVKFQHCRTVRLLIIGHRFKMLKYSRIILIMYNLVLTMIYFSKQLYYVSRLQILDYNILYVLAMYLKAKGNWEMRKSLQNQLVHSFNALIQKIPFYL